MKSATISSAVFLISLGICLEILSIRGIASSAFAEPLDIERLENVNDGLRQWRFRALPKESTIVVLEPTFFHEYSTIRGILRSARGKGMHLGEIQAEIKTTRNGKKEVSFSRNIKDHSGNPTELTINEFGVLTRGDESIYQFPPEAFFDRCILQRYVIRKPVSVTSSGLISERRNHNEKKVIIAVGSDLQVSKVQYAALKLSNKKQQSQPVYDNTACRLKQAKELAKNWIEFENQYLQQHGHKRSLPPASPSASASPSPTPSPSASPSPSQTPTNTPLPSPSSCSLSTANVTLVEGSTTDRRHVNISTSSDCEILELQVRESKVNNSPTVSAVPPGLGTVQTFIVNATQAGVLFSSRPSWYGHKKQAPRDDYCYDDSTQSTYQVILDSKLKNVKSGQTLAASGAFQVTVQLNPSAHMKVDCDLEVDTSMTTNKVDNKTCCANLIDFIVATKISPPPQPTHIDQYTSLGLAEENYHIKQLKGEVSPDDGGLPTPEKIAETMKNVAIQSGTLQACSKALFSVSERTCESATKKLRALLWEKVVDPTGSSLRNYITSTNCYREKIAKANVGLTQAKGAFHYECAYKSCVLNPLNPGTWEYRYIP